MKIVDKNEVKILIISEFEPVFLMNELLRALLLQDESTLSQMRQRLLALEAKVEELCNKIDACANVEEAVEIYNNLLRAKLIGNPSIYI
jgi:hypothetical protein